MKSTLHGIEIDPSHNAVGSVIWLHGLGADGTDFVPIVQELNLPANLPLRFIFPHAPVRPVTLNNGYEMRAWFDIYSLNRQEAFDQVGMAESITFLNSLIDQEIQRGIPANKIILAGFSQGGAVALSAGLQSSHALGGILALSTYFPNAAAVLAQASAANYPTPIFVAHGTEDTVLPLYLGQQVFELLQRNKYPASWHSYAMGHSVCEEEIGDIANWLRDKFTA